MKILQVIDTLDIGGAERVFITMCNLLDENKIDITAFFLLQSGELKHKLNENIPHIELNRHKKWNLKKMKECAIIIKEYDIIHCHFKHVYRYIALVTKVFNIKTKLILQDHGAKFLSKSETLVMSYLLKNYYYIGVSNSLCNWAKSKICVKKDNIFLLENIIIQQKIKDQLNKEYDLLLVSNIKKNKNNAFALTIAKMNDNSLLLIGKNQDEEYYKNIHYQILNPNITINDKLSEVQPILHKAKLGLHTSISETGPLVLIEYLAQGLPFLAYETGEVAKILKPYFPDYFIDNFDKEKWIERINKLITSKPDRQRMQEVFDKHFGQEEYFKKLMKVYQCINN